MTDAAGWLGGEASGHVAFHVLQRRTGEGEPLALASPSVSPGERVVLWHGLPPIPVQAEESALAPVVLQGEVDGRLAYVEQVPRGVTLSGVIDRVPVDLWPFIAKRVVDALVALHGQHQVHGGVSRDRVVLGVHGEVVLFGRGRCGGMPRLDVLDALELLPDLVQLTAVRAAEAAERLAALSPPDAEERLAELISAWAVVGPTVVDQVVLAVVGETDEVVPDIGPDSGSGGGILDRWGATATSTAGAEDTATMSGGEDLSQDLAVTLWGRLAGPRRSGGGPERFEAVQGVPSRGLRTILAEEPPDPMPAPLVGELGEPIFEDGLGQSVRSSGRVDGLEDETQVLESLDVEVSSTDVVPSTIRYDLLRMFVVLAVVALAGGALAVFLWMM